MISAGLCAAVCALSREYGWIAVVAGVIALRWRRQPVKQLILFAATATTAALPWYLRNWAITGNPVYSLSVDGFAVNAVHVAILQQYQELLGLHRWTPSTWLNLAWFLVLFATFQVLGGIAGGIIRFRREGYLLVIALLLFLVWLQSVGYTSGGPAISTRVLSPAMVVLSVAAAGFLEALTRSARWSTALVAALIVCQLWTASHGVFYPADVSTVSLSEWPQKAFRTIAPDAEFLITDRLMTMLPAGTRILSDNANLHAALIDKSVQVVPVWSPEVRFLFAASPDDAERQLRALNIGAIAYYPRSLNTRYLVSASPFYSALTRGKWRIRAQAGSLYLLLPPQ
jgi:hypothetical protein